MRTLLAAASLLLLAATAGAQGHHHHPFDPIPGKFPLIPDMGPLHHPVSTTDPIAQRYFDQGLTLLYGFNYDGAYKSFEQAGLLDEKLAMAEWGMALARGANINIDIDAQRMRDAVVHIERAKALLAHASERERDYIDALSRRYSPTPEKVDWKQLAIAYSEAMERLWKKHWKDELAKAKPNPDPDAAVLYAESLMDLNPWDLWDKKGRPIHQALKILAVLTEVRDHPTTREHVGAVHYRLHVLEPSPRWRQAADEAEILRTLVPASGHLVHMPSHIALLRGDYAAAAEINRRAIEVDHDYKRRVGGEDGYYRHYLAHNLHFRAVALALAEKKAAAFEAVDQAHRFASARVEGEPGLEHYLATQTLVWARFGHWNALADAAPPAAKWQAAHALWQWGRAVAAAGRDNVTAAKHIRGIFRAEVDKVPTELSWGNATARKVLEIAVLDLDARIAKAMGDGAEEERLLRLAAAAEKDLRYDEPPPWIVISKGRYP